MLVQDLLQNYFKLHPCVESLIICHVHQSEPRKHILLSPMSEIHDAVLFTLKIN